MVFTTLIARRCLSSTITRRCAVQALAGNVPTSSSSSSIRYIVANNTSNGVIRSFSSLPPPPTATPPGIPLEPPTSLTPEAGLGAQDAMKLFIQHGLGKQKLRQIVAEKNNLPLVERWQKMIQTYLETQCHVISLLGYKPDETGIGLYSQHLTQAMQTSAPDVQEKLRVAGRDTYRMVLAGAFDIPNLLEEQEKNGELSVVDARNIMHKVSLRMQEPEILEKVAKECASTMKALNDSKEAKQIEIANKHTVVQRIMVTDVYLKQDGADGVSLVQECGFGEGEEGYIRMQSVLAEHQGDPLINQYVGSAMVKLLQSAGIDMGELKEAAQGQVKQQ